jgi:hypothetical protein
MKKHYYLLSTLILVLTVTGAAQIVKTKYTVLDQIEASYHKKMFSDKYSLAFKLVTIEFLDTTYSVSGVEVVIKNAKNEVVGNSLSFSNIGRPYGFSLGAITQRINQSGFIFLTINDLHEIRQFFNQTYGAATTPAEKYTIYKLTINDRMDIGLLYDPDPTVNGWSFFVNIDNAVYETDITSGKAVLMKIMEFDDYLQKISG